MLTPEKVEKIVKASKYAMMIPIALVLATRVMHMLGFDPNFLSEILKPLAAEGGGGDDLPPGILPY